jgi:hypothetical protein
MSAPDKSQEGITHAEILVRADFSEALHDAEDVTALGEIGRARHDAQVHAALGEEL